MRKIAITAAATVVLVLSAPFAAIAASSAVGTADTSISILKLQMTDLRDLTGIRTVDIATGSGFATTDPVRQGLQNIKASFEFVASSVTDTVDTTIDGNFSVSAEGDPNSSDTKTDSKGDPSPIVDGFDTGNLAAGDVTATALTAQVVPPVPSAKATLGNMLMDLSIADTFVKLDDFGTSIVNDSNPTSAKAAMQGLQIGELKLLTLNDLLEIAGGLNPLAVADQLIDLASKFAPTQTATQRQAVEDARAVAIGTINSCLTGATTECSALAVLGLPTLSPGLSPQDVLDYLAGFSAQCEQMLIAAGLSGPLAQAECVVVTPVITGVNGLPQAVIDLADPVLSLPLIDITKLNAGVAAEAFDTHATGSAIASWNSAHVLGREVTQTANFNDEFSNLQNTIEELEVSIEGLANGTPVPAMLQGLVFNVDPLFTSVVIGKDGPYNTASSRVSVLRILLELPQVQSGNAPVSAAAPDPFFIFDARFLTLAADAEHKPEVLGSQNNPDTGPRPAQTGPKELVVFTGLIMLLLGLRLRRWLGDAA